MPRTRNRFLLMGLMVLLLSTAAVVAETVYQKPPKEVAEVMAARPTPYVSVSPSQKYLLFLEAVRYPPIEEVAQPMARLAGLRIDVRTNGLHLAPNFVSYTLKEIAEGREISLKLPAPAKLGPPVWSPDGNDFAFTNTTATGIDLWIGAASSGLVHRVPNVHVNGVAPERRDVIQWLPDNRRVLVRLVPATRGLAPAAPATPSGPDTQESAGHAGPVRTYEDMLASPHDEALLDYYATAQLALVDSAGGSVRLVGKPGIFAAVLASPDGKHILVAKVHRPYSYLHPLEQFPTDVEVWNAAGTSEYTVAKLPLADRIPIDGVRTGPRAWRWLPDQPATLVWAEALDGGNPKEKVPHRDRLLTLAAPFTDAPREVFETVERFRGLQPIDGSSVALVSDYERNKRWLRTMAVDLEKPGDPGRVLFERNVQDRYKDPGSPVLKELAGNGTAIERHGDEIFLHGEGASPAGDHPFLDRYNLATGKTERLFQCQPGSFEVVEAVLDDNGTSLLTRRETPADVPNYFVRTGDSLRALSQFTDPVPQVREVTKKLVKYRREDGVELSFMLYLPPGYKEGTRLPTLVWAYPLEYNDAGTAGQVSGSTDRFNTLVGHQLFALHGYAVLDNAAMPVVGSDPQTVNNTYVQQIVMDAKAAIDKAVEMGVTDRDRVAVGGHSYGAFMTANLLAHSSLFRAGVAESGAYNRTLTPFGFQTERRTFWEAPELYMAMSPFAFANKIKAPLLMTHGEADDNTGTFPIQSERLYQAIVGNGGVVRLVMLPAEAHGYRALETNEHVLYEEMSWLDKYLTPKP